MARPEIARGATLRSTVRDEIAAAVVEAAERATLPAAAGELGPAVEVERPANAEHGDFATNLGLRLAKPLRMAPPAIAGAVAGALIDRAARDPDAAVATAAVAGPGFLNVTVREAAVERLVGIALRDPAGWGRVAAGPRPRHVNVEFVSANPTGPLTVGNARGAFVGDLLA
ncbi:MAG TPA: hypothetical protein VGI98_06320, partial [Candidatus Limnocylindrales bacterium]